MQQIIFIADFIARSTCFGQYYAHHQELESIADFIARSTCFGQYYAHHQELESISSLQIGHITSSSTPYRQPENQSTKYHRQRPSV